MSLTVAVAGASGFVGRSLCERLAASHEVIGLSRSERESTPGGPQRWRACDLYSLLDVERGLAGADVAVYLVHSMLPSVGLSQADFADLDLLLADNFGRAAARAGVKRIVYLGGLLPDRETELSPHLASRREVEVALAAHGVPVTTLRAGLVVGPGGSSFRIMQRLVERLPIMLCPQWTQTDAQPIALADVVTLLRHVIGDESHAGETYDIGGPDVLTYRDMMADVAAALGRRTPMLPVPFFSPGLSELWISTITRTPRELVGPLVESLRHPMLVRDGRLQRQLGIPGMRWRDALEDALRHEGRRELMTQERSLARRPPAAPKVKSVQRLPRPAGATAIDIARLYLSWLPSFLYPLIVVETDDRNAVFRFRFWSRPLLRLALSLERSTEDRTLFYVTGGVLTRDVGARARLEFRLSPDRAHVLAAVHDFTPRLPWPLYRLAHAPMHAVVMHGFGRRLARA